MISLRLPKLLIALFGALAIAGSATTVTAQDNLDRALREGQRSGRPQRVIVKAKPGYEAWARQLIQQRGKQISAEMPSIGSALPTTGVRGLEKLFWIPTSTGASFM